VWERTESKWRGTGWFFLATVAIVVALGMQLSDVPAGGVRGAASCEDVVDGGDRYSYAAIQGCERAIGDRGSMAIAMLAIAGFLVAAGVRRVRRRPNDRTVVGLLLFAVAAALLLWPVNSDVQGARCGSPLLTASDDLYSPATTTSPTTHRHPRTSWPAAGRTSPRGSPGRWCGRPPERWCSRVVDANRTGTPPRATTSLPSSRASGCDR
jgi:hypothetical protein